MTSIRAFPDPDLISGVTGVDTQVLPWPGYTFSTGTSATADHVEASYHALAEHLGVPRAHILTVHQVHGDTVVTEKGAGSPADAIMTAVPGFLLGVKLADCAGVLIYDPVRKAVAAVHSGWRGTAADIVGATVDAMQRTYGTRPAELRCWISPCASGARYEVGADVYAVLAPYCTPQGDRWLFDNRAAITDQLVRAGVSAAAIEGDDLCTMTDDRWHSHRRDGERAGRMLAFIGVFPA